MNFWKATILTIVISLIGTLLTFLFALITVDNHEKWGISEQFVKDIVLLIVLIVSIVPVIIFCLKKYDISIFKQFKPLVISNLGLLLVITLIIYFNITPFVNPLKYFHKLFHGVLEFPGFHISFLKNHTIIDIVGMIFIIPVLEELFFRGIILNQFLKRYEFGKALVLSSLIFAFYHLRPLGIIYLFIYGIIFGYAYIKTNSLFASILLHVIINFLAYCHENSFYQISSSNIVFVIIFPSFSLLVLLISYTALRNGIIQKNRYLLNRKNNVNTYL